jgi:hypothetical protein
VRGIFSTRTAPRGIERGRPQPVADAFSLVGTMSYAKGTFAFFDGTTSEYRKVVENAGTIAGYKVTDITPSSVKLASGGKQFTMKIGTQMRREEKGPGSWWPAVNCQPRRRRTRIRRQPSRPPTIPAPRATMCSNA